MATKTIYPFSFECSSRKNRSGFVHKCKLYEAGKLIRFHKIQYYNRTWESYQFQSVMQCTWERYVTKYKKKVIDEYIAGTGKKRLSEQQKDKILSSNAYIQMLTSISV